MTYENGHISDQLLLSLNNDELDQKTFMEVMEHISSCDYCADRYAGMIEENLMATPSHFKDEILDSAKRIPTTLQAAKIKFYRYCFQVAIGVCASLFLIFGGPSLPMNITPHPLPSIHFEFLENFNQQLITFSESLINKEDSHYD